MIIYKKKQRRKNDRFLHKITDEKNDHFFQKNNDESTTISYIKITTEKKRSCLT